MMNERELKSLISLLDDTDQQIIQEVEHQLKSQGPEIVPYLEKFWESSFDPRIQGRLENIIHEIQFDQTKNELQIWYLSNSFNLLEGLIILNNYQYPSYEDHKIILAIEDLKTEVWRGLHYDMSPLEKVNLMNHVLFGSFGLTGNTKDYHHPQNSYIGQVLDTKQGNPLTLSCIYSIIAQKLDIPIYGINLPKHFVLAYMDSDEEGNENVLFYINAFNRGQVMQKSDVNSFLKQLNLNPDREFTYPCDNVTIIKRALRNLMSAYEEHESSNKQQEIKELFQLLA